MYLMILLYCKLLLNTKLSYNLIDFHNLLNFLYLCLLFAFNTVTKGNVQNLVVYELILLHFHFQVLLFLSIAKVLLSFYFK